MSAVRNKNQNDRDCFNEPTPVYTEIVLQTIVIKEESKLKVLVRMLKDVDVCGISLEGENVGQDGIVSWMVLIAKGTILPIDLDTLSASVPDLWDILKCHVLCNPNLVKIFHNSRPAREYLHHVHGIQLVNIFDTQLADVLVFRNGNSSTQSPLRKLSVCLRKHCTRLHWKEVDFLEQFEKKDFSTNSPMLQKPLPPPEYLKLSALKVKHLVRLRESLMTKMFEIASHEIEANVTNSLSSKTMEAYASMSNNSGHLSEKQLSELLLNDEKQQACGNMRQVSKKKKKKKKTAKNKCQI